MSGAHPKRFPPVTPVPDSRYEVIFVPSKTYGASESRGACAECERRNVSPIDIFLIFSSADAFVAEM